MMLEMQKILLILTAWIINVFLGFAPEWHPLETGAAEIGANFGLFLRLPLNKISLTSEIFFLFLPLPTDYCILPTALFGATPKNAYLWSSPKRFCPSLKSFWSSLKTFRSSPKRFWSSLVNFYPRFGGALPPF
jgi:hypothetical protein